MQYNSAMSKPSQNANISTGSTIIMISREHHVTSDLNEIWMNLAQADSLAEEDGSTSLYGPISNKKYYHYRFDLFSLYDLGIKLDPGSLECSIWSSSNN